jgi:lysylphosphatidylglycerol synthetase-like protein (DUF2156 family)
MTLQKTLSFGLVFAFLFSVCAGILLVAPETAFAAEDSTATTIISEGLSNAATGTYAQGVTASVFIGNLIRVLLSATGLTFLVLTVYAGILYMTAAGDEGKVKKAKQMLTTAVVGLIIIVGAYAITSFVIDSLAEASKPATTSES